MTKKITLLLLFINFYSWAQIPNWTWALNTRMYFNNDSNCVAVDNNGDIYVISDFTESNITLGTNTLTNLSDPSFSDTYIVKYNNQGNVIWAKCFGGAKNDSPLSITFDSANNFYLVGFYRESVNFGAATLVDNDGGNYLAKFNQNGDCLWVKNCGAISEIAEVSSVKVDSSGYIYIGGTFLSSTLTLDSVVVNYADYDVTTNNSQRAFVAKLDASGNCIWARAGQSNTPNPSGTSMRSLDVDTTGSVYITGYFYNNVVNFGSLTLTKTVTTQFNANMYIVKYDSNGNAIWGYNTGSQYENMTGGLSVKTDQSNNVYVSGFFTNTVNFGSTTLSSTGGSQMFTAKFDSAGNILWAKRPNCPAGYNAIQSSDIDENGNLIVAGMFNNSYLDFGNGVTMLITGTGSLFTVKYSPTGTALWGRKAGALNANNWLSVDCHTGNEIYVAGSFESASMSFGSSSITKSTNNYDLFLARLYAVPLGTDDFNESSFISYPNPVKDLLYLEALKEPYSYSLHTINGALVEKGNLETPTAQLSVDGLQSGVYFLTLTSASGKISTRKIIKE